MTDGSERQTALDVEPERFRALGHALVDELAELLGELRSPASRRVTPGESVDEVRAAFDAHAPLPQTGTPAEELLREAVDLVAGHSLFPGHPRFFGYVVGAPAPIGALGDLLAAVVNPNVGGWPLSPVATEIEQQTVRWIAELLGYPPSCGGLLVSGGNMANFVGFLAARRAKALWDVRAEGVARGRLRVYCSAETHTWVQKAADMFGLGTDSIRWLPTDAELRLDAGAVREAIARDRAAGDVPFLVVGAAGTVSTGAIDPLRELARLCRDEDVWLHVDGAYGGFAAALPDAPDDLRALAEADSVAVDPHKWLYTPLEAGCALVRDPQQLLDAFSYRPPYYHLDEEGLSYYEYGPQNSRGFRALKVWLALRQAGREGYVQMIGDDVRLAGRIFELAEADPELEARTSGLSIATFRYVPSGVTDEDYLDLLNEQLLDRLQAGGEAFVSNALIDGRYYLRACIVNFRTTASDVEALPEIVKRLGAEVHAELSVARPSASRGRAR